MSEEKVYYDKGNCTITESRAIIDGTTYPMNNISSVSTGVLEKSGGTLYATGAILAFAGIANMEDNPGAGLVFIIIGAVVAFMGTKVKNDYIVKVGSAGAEKDSLTSQDKELIDEIVNAINEAIIDRAR